MKSPNRAPRLALMFVALLLTGMRSSCDTDPPTLTCTSISISLDPGECVEFENPCGPGWEHLDAFELCDPPAGVRVETERNPLARRLCADATAEPVASLVMETLYTTRSDLGEGAISLTIVPPAGTEVFTATLTATPPAIAVGSSTQLDVLVENGVPPYTYSWSPPFFLDHTNISDPMAAPPLSLTYTVTVRDAAGELAQANVDVTVVGSNDPPSLLVQLAAAEGSGTVTTDPPGIECGELASDCYEPYPLGTVVTLIPTPAPGSVFVGWNGDPDCSLLHLTMDGPKRCEAVFDLAGSPSHAPLRIIGIVGNGRVVSVDRRIRCGIGTPNDCAEIYPIDSVVQISAIAEPGHTFVEWRGDCSSAGDNAEIDVTVSAETRCEAAFALVGGGE